MAGGRGRERSHHIADRSLRETGRLNIGYETAIKEVGDERERKPGHANARGTGCRGRDLSSA
jgi:hypothetical protein